MKKKQIKIAAIVPAYNESGNLKKLTDYLISSFRKNHIVYEIIFIIQGNDNSKKIIEALQIKNKKIKAKFFPHPLGIGYAYQQGYNIITKKYDYVFTLDADLNHHPKYLSKFLDKIAENNSDMVIGSRYIKGGQFSDDRIWKRYLSLIVNTFLSSVLGIKIHDLSSGFRLMRSELVINIRKRLKEKDYPSYMEFIILAKKSGFKIEEIPIIYTPRIWGESKLKGLNTLISYLKFIARIVFNS
jgi:dolichol-phosphate mannosyltransferase